MPAHGEDSFLPDVVPTSRSHAGVYGRLFRDLPPWSARATRNPERRAQELRRAALVDGGPAPEGTARRLFSLAEQLGARSNEVIDNERIPAAYTYFGQFVAHDLSFDPTPLHARNADPQRLRTFRTPALDLDSVYGGGPNQQPFLYDPRELVPGGAGLSFALGDPVPRAGQGGATSAEASGGKAAGHEHLSGLDLPRTREGLAIVADPRNDSHVILSQLHVAFLRFHNRMLAELADRGRTGPKAFEEASRLTRWHYQWILVHDWLPLLTGSHAAVARALSDPERGYGTQPRVYRWKEGPFLPVELTVGVLRFGHAMSRGRYDLNEEARDVPLFAGTDGETSCTGNRPLPEELVVRWGRFVAHRGSRPQASQRIRRRVAASLSHVPELSGSPLSRADLRRGQTLGLPSGQDVARALGLPPHDGHDPLWYYVLKEAELDRWGGTRLGPVARRLLVDVLLGLLHGDPASFLRCDPGWVPPGGRRFRLADLLERAGMPMG